MTEVHPAPDDQRNEVRPNPLGSREGLLYGLPDLSGVEFQLGPGNVNAHLLASPSRPHRNEDALLVASLGPAAVLAVADGVGGLPDGDLAAKTALEALEDAVRRPGASNDPNALRAAILAGFDNADAQVDAMSGATTLTVVELWPGGFRTYNAGDTAALVIDRAGAELYRTVSHSPVGYALEAGLLDESQALRHGARHVISNCLGQGCLRIEMGTLLKIGPGRRIVLASDGLFDNLARFEVAGHLAGRSLDRATAGLAEGARTRMRNPSASRPSKPDDMGLIVFEPTE